MDKDGYPEDDELATIRQWEPKDFHGLMEYMRERWEYADCFEEMGGGYFVSTGGWSGHEDMISALQQNTAWWLFYWQSSRRGGHYEFRPLVKPK